MTYVTEFTAAVPSGPDNEIIVPDTVAQSSIGTHLTNNFLRLAKRAPNSHESVTAPTANNDVADTAGIGIKFRSCSLWVHNTGNDVYVVYTCVRSTAGAAVWRPLGDPSSVFLVPYVAPISISAGHSSDVKITGSYFDLTTVVTVAGHDVSVEFVSPTELTLSLDSGNWGDSAGAGNYAVTVSNVVGNTDTTAAIVEDFWLDLRSIGTADLGILETQNNYNQGSQVEANSGLNRDPSGLWSFTGSGFSQFTKFKGLAFAGTGKRVSFIVRSNVGTSMMIGVGPSDSANHNETSNTQYFQAVIMRYINSNAISTTIYGGGAGGGGANWSANTPAVPSLTAGIAWRLEFDSGGQGDMRVYELNSLNRADWNAGTLLDDLATPFSNYGNPSTLTDLCPFVCLQTNSANRLVAIEVKDMP